MRTSRPELPTTAADGTLPTHDPRRTDGPGLAPTVWFADWRHRMAGNFARRSEGRWDPLTWTND